VVTDFQISILEYPHYPPSIAQELVNSDVRLNSTDVGRTLKTTSRC